MHPTEDELILHFYGEAAARDEAQLDAHLATCPACREAFADLRETLHLVDVASVPEPSAAFEHEMWARIQPALPTRPAVQTARVRQWLPMTAWAAAAVALLSLGLAWWQPRSEPVATVATSTAGPASPASATRARERVLLTALDAHFQQTEMLLVELLNAPEDGQEFAFERATADDLVSSGRLYRVTAQQSGNRELAQMLDDLEAVLLEVARSPETPTRRQFASLRDRVDENGLLFKVRAVTNEIRDRQETLRLASE